MKNVFSTEKNYLTKVDDGGSVLSNSQTFIQSTSNNFMLMAKAHFKGSSFYLGNIMIPILITVGVLAFVPVINGIIWMLFMGMTFSGLATYGTIFFTIRKSTIIKNVNLTATKTGSLYLSTFLLLGVSMFVTFLTLIITGAILDSIGFATQALQIGETADIDPNTYWNVSWKLMISNGGLWYYLIEQIFLCFSLSFFVEKVVSTQKNFFLFVAIYVLAGIFFSGMFSSSLYIDSAGEVAVIDPDTLTAPDTQDVLFLEPYCWGGFNWWIGQFFPHFGANQLAINIGQQCSQRMIDGVWVANPWANVSILNSATTSWQTEYYALAPWIWTLLLMFGAGMLEDKVKK